MEKLKLYILESYNELVHKVTWPTWPELLNTSVVVVTGSIILTLLVFLMDGASNIVTSILYGTFFS